MTLKLWDAGTGRCKATLERQSDRVNNACALLTPHGRRIVSAAGDYSNVHHLKLWDAETGRCEAILEGH